MFRSKVKLKIAEELSSGEAARQAGLEGRARVCARRAAGEAIREYLELRGLDAPGQSAYDLLVYLQSLPEISPEIKSSAGRLLVRVNENFDLPVGVDLLSEADWLVKALEAIA